MMTIEQWLTKQPDNVLYNVQAELEDATVPKNGLAHKFCKDINERIDKGILCINPYTYRKVYLPTIAKMMNKELARRYMASLRRRNRYKAQKEEQLKINA